MVSITAVAVICALGAVGLALWFVPAYGRFRERRVLTCPETTTATLVQVDAVRYAATSLFAHPHLDVRDCARWPARSGCDQACLQQVAGAVRD